MKAKPRGEESMVRPAFGVVKQLVPSGRSDGYIGRHLPCSHEIQPFLEKLRARALRL